MTAAHASAHNHTDADVQPSALKKHCPSIRRISERLTPLYFQVRKDYDYTKATNVNYRLNASSTWGPFRGIREKLDFDYHGNYTQERQNLQDILMSDVIGVGTAHRYAPWIVFTAGAMGAGKSHVIRWLSAKGVFPLSDIVHIDPDVFRTRLPEWEEYVRRDGLTAGMLTHKEAGYCVEIAQEAALVQRKHIWVDGSLRDHVWYAQVFDDIRRRHKAYKIAILYVNASEQNTLSRAQRRAELTGRTVHTEAIAASLQQVPACCVADTRKPPHSTCMAVRRISREGSVRVFVSRVQAVGRRT